MAYNREGSLHGDNPVSSTLKAVGIDKLTVAQRSLLVEKIWDTISEDGDEIPLTESQRQDLERRIAAYEANPSAGSSWEEVKARLRKKPLVSQVLILG
jgi:putative addiction module component (TIGR02574 family)